MAISERSASDLAREARLAAEVRSLAEDPNVVALKVERTRTLVDRMIWIGIILGLAFTMTNVQAFVARTIQAGPGSLEWWSAWLLDPTVAMILLGILIAERQVAPGQIKLGDWSRAAKWSLLTATYVMNTWESYATGSGAGIVLHSVPPLVVFLGAEAVTDCHDKLTSFVYWAASRAKASGRVSPSHEQPVEAVDGPPLPPLPSLVSIPSLEPYKVVTRDERSIVSITEPVPSREQPVIPVALRAQEPVQPRPAPIVPKPVPAKKPSSEVGSQTDPLQIEVERMALELGRRPGIGMVRKALSIGESRARRLIAAIPDPIQTMNGHRPGSAVKL